MKIRSSVGVMIRGAVLGAWLCGSAQACGLARQAEPLPAARAPEPVSDEVIRAMEHAYAGPEFWWKRQQHVELAWGPLRYLGQITSKFFAWLGNLLGDIIQSVFFSLRDLWYSLRSILSYIPGFQSNTGTILLSLILVGLFAWLVWKIRPLVWQWMAPGAHRTSPGGALGAAHEELPEARLLLEDAAALTAKGKYAEAVRAAFLALLACLQNRGLLRYDRSRTNREYLADLRELPVIATAFRDVARPYERAWYGQLPVSAREAEQTLALCGQLVTQQEAQP